MTLHVSGPPGGVDLTMYVLHWTGGRWEWELSPSVRLEIEQEAKEYGYVTIEDFAKGMLTWMEMK